MPLHRSSSADSGLLRCRICHADYVVLVWWAAVDAERWHMLLRCGQCATYCDIVIDNELAKAYDRDLARGMGEIAAWVEQADRARMAEEVDVLTAALERDLVDAGDFAPRGSGPLLRRGRRG